MNKKAFTLIELLGVITILGLISLLVAPTIINQIRNSKNKIDEVTKNLLYSAADLYLDSKQSEFPKTNGSTYCVTLETLVNDGKLSSPIMDANGNEISLDQIIEVDIVNNNYNYSITNSCEMKIVYINGIMSSSDKCINVGTCEKGTAINVQVNGSQSYKFYVINDENNEITLIMDRNIGELIEWISADDYVDNDGCVDANGVAYNACTDQGPLTAVNYLKGQTDGWINVPKRKYTYSDESTDVDYTSFSVNMRSRMLTWNEAEALVLEDTGLLPDYLYENLSGSSSSPLAHGYWTPSSINGSNVIYAVGVIFNGGIYSTFVYSSNEDYGYGVRPVITLVK